MAKINQRKDLDAIIQITQRMTSKTGIEISPQFTASGFFLSNQDISDFYLGTNASVVQAKQMSVFQADAVRMFAEAASEGRNTPQAQNLSLRGQNFFFGGFDDPGLRKLKVMAQSTSGTIDLSLLNKKAQYDFADRYANEVLRLPDLVENLGFPAYSSATANPYSDFFQYLVNPTAGTTPNEGIHPAAFILGRSSINVKRSAGRIEELVKTARGTILSAVGIQEYAAQRKKNARNYNFTWKTKKFKYLWC